MFYTILDLIGYLLMSLIAFPVSMVFFGWIPALVIKGIYKIRGKEFSVDDFLANDLWDKGYLYVYFFGAFSLFIVIAIWQLFDFLLS